MNIKKLSQIIIMTRNTNTRNTNVVIAADSIISMIFFLLYYHKGQFPRDNKGQEWIHIPN